MGDTSRAAIVTTGRGNARANCPTGCATVVVMARVKRSVSLPGELAEAVEAAARAQGTTVSAWLAQSAAHRLRMDAGRTALADWEAEHGPLTEAERHRKNSGGPQDIGEGTTCHGISISHMRSR